MPDKVASIRLQEQWITGQEGQYSVKSDGSVWSYRTLPAQRLKTRIKWDRHCIPLMGDLEPVYFPVASLMADAFLGTSEYVFKDGDQRNCNLNNLARFEDTFQKDERWLEGYEGMYSICNGVVYSFKRNLKRPLKISSVNGYPAVWLMKGTAKKAFFLSKYLKK